MRVEFGSYWTDYFDWETMNITGFITFFEIVWRIEINKNIKEIEIVIFNFIIRLNWS